MFSTWLFFGYPVHRLETIAKGTDPTFAQWGSPRLYLPFKAISRTFSAPRIRVGNKSFVDSFRVYILPIAAARGTGRYMDEANGPAGPMRIETSVHGVPLASPDGVSERGIEHQVRFGKTNS